MNNWICARCGKDLHEVMKSGGTAFPIDPKGKNRRWVCGECIDRKEVPEDVFNVTNDISEVFNGERK